MQQPERTMRHWINIIFLLTTLMVVPKPSSAQLLPNCTGQEIQKFLDYAEAIIANQLDGQEIEMPSVKNCNPKRRLVPLGDKFAGRIAEELRTNDSKGINYMALVLVSLRPAFQPNNPTDYFLLSESIFTTLEQEGILGLPPKPNKSEKKQFNALDSLTSFLSVQATLAEERKPSQGGSSIGNGIPETPIAGASPRQLCDKQETENFLKKIDSNHNEQKVSSSPPLLNCEPDGQFTHDLSMKLRQYIGDTNASNVTNQKVRMAQTLREVKSSFRQGKQPEAFRRLSKKIIQQSKTDFEDLELPAGEMNYGDLDMLIRRLETSRDSRPLPSTVLYRLAGILVVFLTLMLAVALILNQGKSKREKNNSTAIYDGTRTTNATQPRPDEPETPAGLFAAGLSRIKFKASGESKKSETAPHSNDLQSLVPHEPRTNTEQPIADTSNFERKLDHLEKRVETQTFADIDPTAHRTLQDVIESLREVRKKSADFQTGTATDLQSFDAKLTTLRQSIASFANENASLRVAVNEARRETKDLREGIKPPLAAQFETERALLKEDWKRFLNTQRELGQLVESFADDEDHKVVEDLLKDLPKAVEPDRQLSQMCDSKLAPLRMYNQQLRQLLMVPTKRTNQELPTIPEEQQRKLLVIRDSAHLLATYRNTDKGDELLLFKPSKWCAEELPELADLFLRHYQLAQAESQTAGLERAREVVLKALRIGKMEPIEIIIGQTDFDSSIHVGTSKATESDYHNGKIVRVVKNGFRSLRNGEILVQPEVIVNRL